MNNPPTGTVTFLFTDIEGSTRLWEQHPHAMPSALARHDEILRSKIEAHNGHIFKTVGDAFCAAFPTALDALNAAIATQRAIRTENWGEVGTLTVRSGIHSGAAQERDGDYFGQPLNRVARLIAAGHGGQILVSASARELLLSYLPEGLELRDMGERRLRDLTQPEHIYQAWVVGLPTEFPLLRTLDYRPNNLPAQLTILIGREKELETLGTLLNRADVRLVTLTGPGGTGKTRLALQLAADLLDDFPDGAWFVDLAPITDTHLVLPTMARTLGIQESAGQPLLETLKAHLKDKQLLCVMDNFEQVLEAATVVGHLIAGCPLLKVLSTSRIALRLRGEHEYAVSPLSLPNPRHTPTIERITQYDAVRLFIERAQAAKSDFMVDNDNAPAVAEICVRLDGLPLAIELAAARVKILPPKAMLSRLQNRLKLLTGGARDLPARQQTILSTIDWSYELLDEAEKQFFRRIAVFQGGRTLEAMEAVCNFDGKLQMDVLDRVESLVSKNLLQQREGAEGEPRFWILETIHEYARTRLEESADHKALQREHAFYFMTMAEEAEPHLVVGQEKWLDRLEGEHDNIRAALRWARDNNETEIGLRLAGALYNFWNMRSYFTEGREQLVTLLTPEGQNSETGPAGVANSDDAARAKAFAGAGVLAWNQGDYAASLYFFEQALAIQKALDNKIGMSFTFTHLGRIAQARKDHTSAASFLEQALATARAAGDKVSIAWALMHIGIEAFMTDDNAQAHLLYEEALTLFKQVGDQFGSFVATMNLGVVAHRAGNDKLADKLFRTDVVSYMALGEKRVAGGLLYGLGIVAGTTGQPKRGARLLGAFEALRETTGSVMEPEDQEQHDHDVVTIHSQLDDGAFAKAWAEGRVMSMDEALAYALEDETATNPE